MEGGQGAQKGMVYRYTASQGLQMVPDSQVTDGGEDSQVMDVLECAPQPLRVSDSALLAEMRREEALQAAVAAAQRGGAGRGAVEATPASVDPRQYLVSLGTLDGDTEHDAVHPPTLPTVDADADTQVPVDGVSHPYPGPWAAVPHHPPPFRGQATVLEASLPSGRSLTGVETELEPSAPPSLVPQETVLEPSLPSHPPSTMSQELPWDMPSTPTTVLEPSPPSRRPSLGRSLPPPHPHPRRAASEPPTASPASGRTPPKSASVPTPTPPEPFAVPRGLSPAPAAATTDAHLTSEEDDDDDGSKSQLFEDTHLSDIIKRRRREQRRAARLLKMAQQPPPKPLDPSQSPDLLASKPAANPPSLSPDLFASQPCTTVDALPQLPPRAAQAPLQARRPGVPRRGTKRPAGRPPRPPSPDHDSFALDLSTPPSPRRPTRKTTPAPAAPASPEFFDASPPPSPPARLPTSLRAADFVVPLSPAGSESQEPIVVYHQGVSPVDHAARHRPTGWIRGPARAAHNSDDDGGAENDHLNSVPIAQAPRSAKRIKLKLKDGVRAWCPQTPCQALTPGLPSQGGCSCSECMPCSCSECRRAGAGTCNTPAAAHHQTPTHTLLPRNPPSVRRASPGHTAGVMQELFGRGATPPSVRRRREARLIPELPPRPQCLDGSPQRRKNKLQLEPVAAPRAAVVRPPAKSAPASVSPSRHVSPNRLVTPAAAAPRATKWLSAAKVSPPAPAPAPSPSPEDKRQSRLTQMWNLHNP